MILSTTPTIEGHPIREYRGVVTGETIIGTNFVKDFFANIRDRPFSWKPQRAVYLI